MKAIETIYAGCRFRSRLEARWAVFLDEIGMEWSYEPEGFETPAGRYLPDFYLPEHGRWIEIKGGSFTKRDRERAAWFAESRWQIGEGYRLLQGDIPRQAISGPRDRPLLPIIHWSQVLIPVDEEALPAAFSDGKFDPEALPNLNDADRKGWGDPLPIVATPGTLLEYGAMRDFAQGMWSLASDLPTVNAALTTARSARFEYGERGRRT